MQIKDINELNELRNDFKATYSMEDHRYVLNRDYFEQSINGNLDEILNHDRSIDISLDAEVFLDRVSQLLYDFVFEYSSDPDAMEYYLSLVDTNKQLKKRKVIIDCMVELGYDILINNKELGVFYADQKPVDLVPPAVFQKAQANGLITRSKLNPPDNYFDDYGVLY